MESQRTVANWGIEDGSADRSGHLMQQAIVLLVAVAVAVILTFAIGPIWGIAPVLIANVVIVVGVVFWINNQGLLALKSLNAIRCAESDEPRLWNITRGLSATLGVKAPSLYVVPEGGPNAFVCMARGPALAATESLLRSYTRTELEAVVAHCLVRFASGSVERTMLAVALGPLGTKSVPPVGTADDVRACAVTRYPPALANAIEKAEARAGRFAPFWFVARGGGHADPADRADAIRDL